MTRYNQVTGSGDGTRPTTDGGVDNIGAGERFTSKRTVNGEEPTGPAPRERMAGNRRDAEGTRHDDSSPFELHEDLTPDSNKEPIPSPDEMPANSPKD